jgi:hypothetical protein
MTFWKDPDIIPRPNAEDHTVYVPVRDDTLSVYLDFRAQLGNRDLSLVVGILAAIDDVFRSRKK